MTFLKNIKSSKNFEPDTNENATVFSDSDSYGGNSLFKIKIRPLSDLSGTPGKGDPEPTQAFAEGDVVKGRGIDDKEEHEGAVISVKFDDDSQECTDISIEEHGQMFKLIPGTVKMVKDNGSDNADADEGPNKPVDTNDPTLSQYTFEHLSAWEVFSINDTTVFD
jgi:hypothetical protein